MLTHNTEVITVTLAPAVDWTVTVDRFDLSAVNEIVDSTKEASGKGVNVAWALHRADVPTLAVLPTGGLSGQFMQQEFDKGGLKSCLIPIEREIRTNISLLSPGDSTKINQAGTQLTEAEMTALFDAVIERARTTHTVALCGSLPKNAPAETYQQLIAEIKNHAPGARVVLDTSKKPFSTALSARPDLIKPNAIELATLTGHSLHTLGDVADAAHEAMDLGAGAVLASLGGDGSLLVTREATYHAEAVDIPFCNTVGAGDALLAGFISSSGCGPQNLFTATLWASSAVACPTTLFPVRPEFSANITVRETFDAGYELSEPAVLAPIFNH